MSDYESDAAICPWCQKPLEIHIGMPGVYVTPVGMEPKMTLQIVKPGENEPSAVTPVKEIPP